MPPPPTPLRNPALAAFLAWLVPGLGHYYQGRKGKAILYATCILGLYIAGLAIGEGKVVFWTWTSPLANSEKFRFGFLGQFFVGAPAVLAMIQATIKHYAVNPTARHLWGLFAEPAQEVINGQHARLGKLYEISWVYTVVAGLLNILAIFDAYDGPADAREPEAAAPKEAVVAAPPQTVSAEVAS